jgi:hypothetical protein
MADETLLLARMHTDSAYTRLASDMAMPIEVEYRHEIYDRLLLTVRGSVPRGVSV